MSTNLVNNCIYQLQSTSTCIYGLILDSINACFEEKYQVFIGYNFVSSQMGKNTKDMTSTEWAFIVNSLE